MNHPSVRLPYPILLLVAACLCAVCDPGTEPVVFEAGPLGAVALEAGEAVQIRSILAATGAPALGRPTRRAVELAALHVGRIRGRNVELGAPEDDGCSPTVGRETATRIAADPKVVGIVGTTCSAAAVAVSPVISAAGLVMIAPSTTSPHLTSDLNGNPGPDYHPGYYRVAGNDLYQARALADFAYGQLGLRRVAAVHDGDPYTSALAGAFRAAFDAVGGEVPVVGVVAKGETNMDPVLAELAAGEPDAIFLPLFLQEGSNLVARAKTFEGLEDVALIAGSALLVSDFLSLPESEGIYLAGTETRFDDNANAITGRRWTELLAEYESVYGGPPESPYWSHGYDAATMLLGAIDAVAVERGERLFIDRAALRDRLSATSFDGLIGRIVCDGFGDCGTGRVNIYLHDDSAVTDPSLLEVVFRFVP